MSVPRSWYKALNLTLLGSLVFLGNEWLFEFTKEDRLAEIHNAVWSVHPALLFVRTWILIAVPAWLCTLVICAAIRAARGSGVQLETAQVLVPSFLVALAALSMLDGVTAAYGFSSIKHPPGLWHLPNLAYAIVFLAALWFIARKLFRIGTTWLLSGLPSVGLCCVALIAVAAGAVDWWLFSQRIPEPVARDLPNIFVLSLESALADLSSVYGDVGVDSMPFFRRFASGSLLVENYFSTAHDSRPALNTIISGLSTFEHRGTGKTHPIIREVTNQNLLHYLRSRGYDYYYETAPGNRYEDFDPSFTFTPEPPLWHALRMERFVVSVLADRARSKLWKIFADANWPGSSFNNDDLPSAVAQAGQEGRPFFLHVHVMRSHGPYSDCDTEFMVEQLGALPAARTAFESCYLAKLRWADGHAERIVQTLRDLGHAEDTLFVIAGDHVPQGEYMESAPTAMKAMMRSTLLLRFPDAYKAGGTISMNVQTEDIAPTILDYLDLPPAPWMKGTSILTDEFHEKRLRPIVIHDEHERAQVVVCDRFLSLPWQDIAAGIFPEPRMWPRVPGHTDPCPDIELPSAAAVKDFLEAFRTHAR